MTAFKRTFAFALTVLILFFSSLTVFAQSYTYTNLDNKIQNLLSYELSYTNSTDLNDFADSFLAKNAGTSVGDWFIIALGRYGARFNTSSYLNKLDDVLSNFYLNGINNAKITDLQRFALAYTACGKDIKNIQGHNLLADCTYNRELSEISAQGINTLAYSLIVLDSNNFYVPKNAKTTRNMIISEILSLQLSDGGFALNGSYADTDTTAIVISALAPYYKKNSNVQSAVNTALEKLSKMQKDSGAFSSYGIVNCESTAQVITALTSLGIDPEKDARFIKDGNSTVDALFKHQLENGGFVHIIGKNPNQMSTYQALHTMVAYKAFLNTDNSLFDFTESDPPQAITDNSVNNDTTTQPHINSAQDTLATEPTVKSTPTVTSQASATSESTATQPTTEKSVNTTATTEPAESQVIAIADQTPSQKPFTSEPNKPINNKVSQNFDVIITALILALCYSGIFIYNTKKEGNK